jgi:long-chain acyl-CoA synthetase
MTATVISGSNLVTGSTIDQRAAKVATGLAEMGIGAGDTVAILLRNDPVFFEISFGANLLGANVVPVNWHFRSDEALFVIADSGAKLIVAHEDLLPVLGDRSLLSLPILVCPVPQEVAEAYGSPVSTIDEWASWRDKHAEWRGEPQITRFGMIYTSGTTGKPKGVKREPADAEMAKRMAALMATALGLVPGQTIRTVITGPIYHAAPNTYALVAGRVGELVAMQPRFDAEELLALIEHHRLTHVHLVPTNTMVAARLVAPFITIPKKPCASPELSAVRWMAARSVFWTTRAMRFSPGPLAMCIFVQPVSRTLPTMVAMQTAMQSSAKASSQSAISDSSIRMAICSSVIGQTT